MRTRYRTTHVGGPSKETPIDTLTDHADGADPDAPDVDPPAADSADDRPEAPRPINWNHLSPDEAATAWADLNAWVDWLRHTYGLPATIVPPYWHRHPELVWELSALHLHWLGAYHPDQHASAPIGWHHDFTDARHRLRDWVAQSGTRLDSDRPLRPTLWPGETPAPTENVPPNANRDEDFVRHVIDDVNRRAAV